MKKVFAAFGIVITIGVALTGLIHQAKQKRDPAQIMRNS